MKNMHQKKLYLLNIINKISLFSKVILMVIVFGLLLNHINIVILVKAFEKPIETIIQDHSITEINNFERVEIEKEKTKYSKTYKYDNGLYETEIFNKAVHYLDNNEYINIDNTLIDYETYYQNNKNSYKVTFPKTLKDNKIDLSYSDYSLKIYYDGFDSNAVLNKDIDRSIENLHDDIYYKINDDMSIRYDVLNESIKENIILYNYIENFSYSFFIETDLLLIEENDKLYFYNNDELIYLFDNYLMYDKDYNLSYDILTNISQINDSIYKITITPNNEYLLNAIFPVTIDPEIHLVDGGLVDGIVTLYEVDKLNNTSTFKSIGSFNVNNRTENVLTDDLVSIFNIHIPRYYSSNISELLTRNQLMYANLELTTVSTNAYSDTSAILKYDNSEIDRVVFHSSNVFNHKFNIIDAIGDEIDNFINNDLYFNLELIVSGLNNTNVNYSLGGDLTGNKPIITIGYLSEAGLSDYYTYEDFPMNNESNCYVAHNSGNLTYVYEDYVSDSLLSLSHIYNTNRLDNSIYGSGFNINYNEYIEDDINRLKLYKGNGKIIEFIFTSNNEYLSKDGTGETITKIYNGSILTGYERKVDSAIYVYNGNGKLINIYLNEEDRVNGVWDSSAKKISITYTNGLITKIEDSYGNYIELSYTTIVNGYPTTDQVGLDYLADISVYVYNLETSEEELYLELHYYYESGKLVEIEKEYPSITHRTWLDYNSKNQLLNVYRNSKGYTFTYDNRNRIERVKVYNGLLTNGDYIDFSYNKNGRETYVTNSKNEVTKYAFDNSYHTVKCENSENYTTFYRYYDIYQDSIINYNLNHKIINQSNSFKNISNIITNHGFEIVNNTSNIYGWTKELSGLSTASIETNNYLYGSRVLKLNKNSGNAKIYQEILVEQGKEYIISCYINNSTSGTGAYIDVVGVDGVVNSTSRTNNIKETDGFNRYEYKFTSSFTGRARIYLVNDSTGCAYFDNVNVSENYIDTRYNYLENSSFEKGTTGWSGYNYIIDDNDYFDNNSGSKVLKLACTGYITQIINKTGLSGDTFVFGGYSKYENYTGCVTVSLTFNYINGNHTTYSYTYNNPVEVSEYYMVKAEALDDYLSIQLKIENNSPSSYVWVDNYSLYNESYGINISYNNDGFILSSYNEIEDKLTTITYDNNENITTISTNNDIVTYSYDTRGNLNQIQSNNVSTNFTVDNDDNIIEVVTENSDPNGIKYLQPSTAYSSDGLYVTEETNVLGNITTYSYDYLTGLVTNIIDSNLKEQSYTYDDLGNITSFTEGESNNTKTVTYTYDINSNLTSITIGNIVYTFTYNSYNDLTSISINNSEIASYNYDNSGIYRGELLSETLSYGTIYFSYYDNGLTKSISHGNTKILEYIYNDYGEIASIIDYKEGITYYYNYDYQNRLINVNRSDGNNITYSYDDKSRLVNRSNINGGSSYTYSDVLDGNGVDEKLTEESISNIYNINYSYTNDDYSNLDVVSFYINNSLMFEKEYTQEVVGIDNQDYYTGRISEIEYIVGQDHINYEYTYDDYNNITSINGYIDFAIFYEEYNYYDVFNQITSQVIIENGNGVLNEYYYDYNGNITSFTSTDINNQNIIHSGSFNYNYKNEITSYTLDGLTYNCNYNNGLLTNYRGNSIVYDFGKITEINGINNYIYYSYNASGIRTSKNVNGVITNYILDDNNIIRETTGNNVIDYYYDSNNDVIGFSYNGNKYLYLKNLQNDIIGIVDSYGDMVVEYYYDAYGNIINITDLSGINLSNINPFRYKSYYYDNETGWYYLNSRFYDPIIKRFITPDDIDYLGVSGSALSYNLYSYCENNPVNEIDNNGNDAVLIVDYSKVGLPILGHMALIVENSDGQWNLIEFNGNIVRIGNDIGRFGHKSSIWESFLSSEGFCGWKGLYIKGNFTKSLKYAEDNRKKYDGKYNLFTNNCLHFVRNALRQGKCDNDLLQLYFKCSTTIIPRVFFNNAFYIANMKVTFLAKIKIKGGYYA